MVVDPFVLRAIMEASGPVDTLDGEVAAVRLGEFVGGDHASSLMGWSSLVVGVSATAMPSAWW